MPRRSKTAKKIHAKKPTGLNTVEEVIEEKDVDDVPMSSKALTNIEQNYKRILEMQDKILSAPAMNGGFTTLLYKVENIEDSQTKLVQKVDQIHGVLYEPDNGLYARLKNVENECVSVKDLGDIEREVHEIKLWKSSEEKQSQKEEEKDGAKDKLLLEHEATLKELQGSIQRYNAAMKWVAVSLGGGLLSMIGKLIYDYVSGHIKIV